MRMSGFGETGRELFSQFLFRISREFEGKRARLGLFSTLKYLNAPNDRKLREKFFRYTAERGFLFSSENFEGSKGRFPVAFAVWNMEKPASVESQELVFDVFDREARKVGVKRVYTGDRGKLLSAWVRRPPTIENFSAVHGCDACFRAEYRRSGPRSGRISLLSDVLRKRLSAPEPDGSVFGAAGQRGVVFRDGGKLRKIHGRTRGAAIAESGMVEQSGQFYSPEREPSEEFVSDCAVWSAFADSNNTCSLKEVVYKGNVYRVKNQLFPFSLKESEEWSGGG